ncbi:MAG: hypothetical protein Q9219_006479 [cf. Caloplaca sp. 3 TL-2023]
MAQNQRRKSSHNDPRLGGATGPTLEKQFGLRQHQDNAAPWAAEIALVQRCDSTGYDGGRGYSTVFEYSPTPPNAQRRCFLTGQGDMAGLTFTLTVNAVFQDPNPTVLHQFSIPSPHALVSLRLFDKGMFMEIHVDPVRRGRSRPLGDYWEVRFRAHNNPERKLARAMLRRLENLTREMPDAWFKYRNYFTQIGIVSGEEAAPPTEPTEGYHRVELSSGHAMAFTGHLATAAFQRALGHVRVRPARRVSVDPEEGQELIKQPRLLRSRVREGRAYMFSSLSINKHVSAHVIKNGKVDKVLSKRETRRANRAMQGIVASGDEDVVLSSGGETPPYLFGPLDTTDSGANQTAADDEHLGADNTAAGVREPGAGEPAAGEESVAINSADDSDEAYPIKGVLDEAENSDGETMYLVDWEGEYSPSWQPVEDISMAALQEWNAKKQRSKKRTASNRGRGRDRGHPSRKRGRKQ